MKSYYSVPGPPPADIPEEDELVSFRGSRLAVRTWFPVGSSGATSDSVGNGVGKKKEEEDQGGVPSAVCLLVHGRGWHSGYYEGLAGRLNRCNVAVVAYDQAGQGYSSSSDGKGSSNSNPSSATSALSPRKSSSPSPSPSLDDSVEDLFTAACWAKQRVRRHLETEMKNERVNRCVSRGHGGRASKGGGLLSNGGGDSGNRHHQSGAGSNDDNDATTLVDGIPFFLLGESTGALQVLAAGLDLERQKLFRVSFSGLILLSAALEGSPTARNNAGETSASTATATMLAAHDGAPHRNREMPPPGPTADDLGAGPFRGALNRALSSIACCWFPYLEEQQRRRRQPPPPKSTKLTSAAAALADSTSPSAEDFDNDCFDDAFGNKEWAVTARIDPAVNKNSAAMAAYRGSELADSITSRAVTGIDVPLLAVHALKDCCADCGAVWSFFHEVGRRGEAQVEGYWVEDTTGHRLLQDHRDVTDRVKDKIATWIASTIAAAAVEAYSY